MALFTPTSWANVNFADGTVLDAGQTTPDAPDVPAGTVVITADQLATILGAQEDHLQVRLLNGAVRIRPMPVPVPVDLEAIRQSAYVTVDAEAEAARGAFLTPGSGQALEYQQTAGDATRLLALFGLQPVPTGGSVGARLPALSGRPVPPRLAGVVPPPAPFIDPFAYPWLIAEQDALVAIGRPMKLVDVALSVVVTMRLWDQAGAAIKQVRRQAKLRISVAPTPEAISAVVAGLVWPVPPPGAGASP